MYDYYVISNARKMILRPEADAPVVQFPPGAKINDWGVNKDSPTVVVRNSTEEEPSWQGVDHDSGVVIVNEVPEEASKIALDIFEQGEKTNGALMLALYFLASSGHGDQYTTGFDFVHGKLSPAGRMVDEYTGIVKRDDRDLTPCWREDGKFWTAPNGKARVIEPEILLRTYREPNGLGIVLNAVPEGRPKSVKE